MSDMETLALGSIAPELWRNGGGVTRTLAREGDEWRVSIAEVQKDGSYSRFEGLSRISFVLRGDGVVLRDADHAIELLPRQAMEYDGDTPWQATLIDGPVSVLNVMSRRGRYRVKATSITRSIAVEPGRAAVALALGTGCRLNIQSDEAHELNRGNAAIFRTLGAALRIEAQRDSTDLLIVITIEPAHG